MLTDDLCHSTAETEGFVIVSDPLPTAADLPAVPRVSPPSSPVGLHRVLEPTGDAITLPQAARRLDARQEALEREMDALHDREQQGDAAIGRDEEALDRRQEELEDEQDRASDAMSRDLETLVRQAIQSGKAQRP